MNPAADLLGPPAATRAGGQLLVCAEKFGRSRAIGEETDDAAEVFEPEGVAIVAIADGLGSAKCGRLAALRAVAALKQNFPARPHHWSAGRTCEEIIRHLNSRLWQEGLARFEAPELASTIAVAAVEGSRLWALNAGDSRIYLWREHRLRQISTDHRESEPGRRHVLTRALGLTGDLPLAIAELEVSAGDVLLLCTDGVTDVLDDQALVRLLLLGARAAEIVAEAARRATDETRDDATAVTLQIVEPGAGQGTRGPGLRVPGALAAGEVVDGFTLRQSFRASDRIWLAAREGRSYVLKFPPRAAATDEVLLGAFLREIWHATQLQSDFFPAICLPEQAAVHFYAQEYLAVPTLRKWLTERGQLPPAQAVELGRFLLGAEQFLLGHGFAHGDIKPENILVLPSEPGLRFKLIDLGSAAEIFSVQGRAGTPSYLAPERFGGAAVTECTEIFAIGVVLYEALTGRLPYGEIEPFQTPLWGAPRLVTAINQHVPSWLEAIVLRATSADPARRQQSYSEVRFELDNPEQVQPFFRPGTPLLERNPQLFYKIGFFLMLAVALVLGCLLIAQAKK
jgi:serine/threonine protein phosphatase PrpC